ncbi:MAG: diacylglycerol/lipid kinase family protein [Spirochaetota bacterium]
MIFDIRGCSVDRCEKSVCVILNPSAAKGRAGRLVNRISRQLEELGCRYVVHESRDLLHVGELAKQAVGDGFDVIAAAGGDGTVSEVAGGMIFSKEAGSVLPEFAVLPIGRGNDFAYAAGLPKQLDRCVALIAKGRSTDIDVGRVYGGLYPDGRCFVNGIGIGFEPMVTMTAGEFKHVGGLLSYILAFGKVMMHYPKAVRIDMKLDGVMEHIETQQLSVCNGRRMGGAFIMGPDAELDDGLLDLGYVNKPVTLGTIVYMAGKFLRGTQKKHRLISSARIKHLVLQSPEGGLVCHADGETVATDAQRLEVEVLPGALGLMRGAE